MLVHVIEHANLAQLTADSGTSLRNVLLGIVGTFLVVVLAVRGLSAFADERYGKLVTLIIAAVPVAGFCYFPDQTVDLLKGLYASFTGAA